MVDEGPRIFTCQGARSSVGPALATLGRECREWAPGAAHAEVETLIEENSRNGDVIIFTDGSVTREKQSGWEYSAARVNSRIVSENSSATDLTLSSMATEINAITLALPSWLSRTTQGSCSSPIRYPHWRKSGERICMQTGHPSSVEAALTKSHGSTALATPVSWATRRPTS